MTLRHDNCLEILQFLLVVGPKYSSHYTLIVMPLVVYDKGMLDNPCHKPIMRLPFSMHESGSETKRLSISNIMPIGFYYHWNLIWDED